MRRGITKGRCFQGSSRRAAVWLSRSPRGSWPSSRSRRCCFWPSVTVEVGSSQAAHLDGAGVFAHGGLLARFWFPRAPRPVVALSALTLVGAGCSGRTIVAVDPSCTEGGATGCSPDLQNDLDRRTGVSTTPPAAPRARDWSSWGNNGTLVGLDPATAWVAGGPEGGALSAQGKGYVNVPDSASIDSITDQVTVAAWMFLTAPVTSGTYATAISRQIGTGFGQHYHLSVNDQNQAILFITTTDGGAAGHRRPADVPTANLGPSRRHLRRQPDPPLRQRGRGGQPGGHRALRRRNQPGHSLRQRQRRPPIISEFVPGQLDEVMLYRRALGADEIAQLACGALLPSGAFHPDAGP